MPVVSALCPLSLQTIFDIEGIPVRPARTYFFHAQTQNPLVVYQDALLSVAHQQPVLTTGNGRIPPVFVGPDTYRMRIFDSFGQLVEDIDGIPGAVVPDSGGGGGGGGTIEPGDPRLLQTGDMVAAFSNALRPGWVRCAGKTIGNSLSGATERANTTDCLDLFTWLWEQDFDHMLPVVGGRGVSAAGDWGANKQITLPDLRCRPIIGMDGMGNVASNRLAAAIMDDASTPAMLGGHGGRDKHLLLTAQMPKHNHAVSGGTDTKGAHTHPNSYTDSHAGHTHSVPGGGGSTTAGPGTTNPAAATGSQTTGLDGGHFHYLTGITSDGSHAHVLTGVTVTQVGSDEAHPQVPPFFTGMVYIKL